MMLARCHRKEEVGITPRRPHPRAICAHLHDGPTDVSDQRPVHGTVNTPAEIFNNKNYRLFRIGLRNRMLARIDRG
jgi:hypothetical protein